ncbi:MAG: HDOD domain-containing protein, partial [Vicinamibacterales bacterium]|nr:HDOD domain-containing protein [Vicinamibacterales bacterium]
KDLPTLPPVAMRLLDMAADDDVGLRDIGKVIETDQALSAKVLQIANSSHIGLSTGVRTVERATLVLGTSLLRSVALSVLVMEVFKSPSGEKFVLRDFWHHNIACAIASELLAVALGFSQSQEAFMAGLLHDVGKLTLSMWDHSEYEAVVDLAHERQISLLAAEEASLGLGHTTAGRLLMEQWRFPESLTAVAWLHHQPVSDLGDDPRQRLAFVVKCADTLCHLRRFGHSGNPTKELDLPGLSAATGLSFSSLDTLSHEVVRRFEEVSGCFDWEGTTPELYLAAVTRANNELGLLQQELLLRDRRRGRTDRFLDAAAEVARKLMPPMSRRKGVRLILEGLQELIPCKMVAAVATDTTRASVEIWLAREDQTAPTELALPLQGEVTERQRRDPTAWLKQAMTSGNEEMQAVGEVTSLLARPTAIRLPLTDSQIISEVLLEPIEHETCDAETQKLLGQYAQCATLALENLALIERLDQRTEDLAQAARRTETTRQQLFKSEQLATVGRLAAGAAHEINNPLMTITGRAQLLLPTLTEGTSKRSVETIIAQCTRISKIIGDLMGFARPMAPKIEATDVAEVIRLVLSLLEGRLQSSGIELNLDLPSDLPVLAAADPKQLEQVFLNLVINAIHAMESDGQLTIRALRESGGEHVVVAVRDTGPGIARADLPVIFDPFFTTKPEGEGSGLGLAISRSIIDAHGGRILADSEPGKGAVFTVYLPVLAETDEPVTDNGESPEDVGEGQKGPARILVVDDEVDLREMLQDALQLEGYQVDLASDGNEGIRKLTSAAYDALVLDLKMPRTRGTDVLRMVKKRFPALPVIIISGLARDTDFQLAEAAGAFVCLKKPFYVQELVAHIQRALGTHLDG